MNRPLWRAGVARIAITPDEPMWLAGWAARREPAKEKAMDLFAKALALQDAQGERVVIVTADLIALPRALTDAVAARVKSSAGVGRDRLLFNASHTHTGPEIRPDKVPFFEIPEKFAAKIPAYLARLESRLVDVIERALAHLHPATLEITTARATFAQNRRAAGGPVDHTVPMLAVRHSDGALAAVLFGYACHNLVLPPSYCAFHGDYAGVAQLRLEERFPGATALFVAGAGADIDPAPRGSVEQVETHGAALTDAVEHALSTESRPVAPRLRVTFADVELALQPVPPPAQLQADATSDDRPRRRKAEFLLRALEEKRVLATTQKCPVHVLRLGAEVLLIALAGEPVIDFGLEFQREFAGPVVWVAGYSNDMFGYLPTRRVQQEGGYEAGRAALWSALPMPVAETTEERVVEAVRKLVRHTA